jgi:uncharacterized protein (DUF1778 family)
LGGANATTEGKKMKPNLEPKNAVKASKVQLRLRPGEKELIARAARLQRTTLTSFMVENAYSAAQRALADQVHFALSPERWKAFCEALDAPPRNIPALRDLLNRPSVFDDRKARHS